jgi:hypothetical protein
MKNKDKYAKAESYDMVDFRPIINIVHEQYFPESSHLDHTIHPIPNSALA